MRTHPLSALVFAGAIAAAFSAAAQTPPDIGVAATVVNHVDGTIGQQTRAKATGDKVFQNEVIRTAAASKGQLLFRDETSLTVGPNSEVALDKFVYNPQGASALSLNATRGVFRFISGSLPSRSYEIKTPAATIAVRGTIVDILLLLDGTAIFRNGEGSFVAATLFGNINVDTPGQVLTLRPGSSPDLRGKLEAWQKALFAALDDPGKNGEGVPVLPDDGQKRRDELRDQLQGGGKTQQIPNDY